jgi:hypothetical protein
MNQGARLDRCGFLEIWIVGVLKGFPLSTLIRFDSPLSTLIFWRFGGGF